MDLTFSFFRFKQNQRNVFEIFLCLLIFFAFSFELNSQSIYNSWYSANANVCLTLQKEGFSHLNEFEHITFKKRKDKLIIIEHFGNVFFGKKQRFKFKIEKLTSDTLVLNQESVAIEKRCESISDNIIVFIAVPEGCDNRVIYIKQ